MTDYTKISRDHVLPQRQHSLLDILGAAIMTASESGQRIAVIYAPIYVDDYVDSGHVYCPAIAAPALFPKRDHIEWAIDAFVEPNGTVFFKRTEDALLILEHTKPGERIISIEVEAE